MSLLAKWLIADLQDPSNRQVTMTILVVPLVIGCLRYGLQVVDSIEKKQPLDASWDSYHSALGRIERTFSALGFKKSTLKKVYDLGEYIKAKEAEKHAQEEE